MYKPTIISFVGIDGSGKTTTAMGTAHRLSEDSKVLVMDREPYLFEGDNKSELYGDSIWSMIPGKIVSMANTIGNKYGAGASFLTYAIYNKYLESSAVNENRPDVVIRARDSIVDGAVFSRNYFPFLFSDNPKRNLKIIRGVTSITQPDLLLYLDLSPEDALKRLEARGRNLDAHENREHMKKMRLGYEQALPAYKELGVRVVDMDARNSIEYLVEKSYREINSL